MSFYFKWAQLLLFSDRGSLQVGWQLASLLHKMGQEWAKKQLWLCVYWCGPHMEDSTVHHNLLFYLQNVSRWGNFLFPIFLWNADLTVFFFLNHWAEMCILFPTEVAPTEPPQLPGNCPESKKRRPWIPFRGHCYAFLSSMVDNWAQASVECLKMGKYYISCFWYITSLCINCNFMSLGLSGASLVSIQDPVEETFIQQSIELLQDSAKSFWIGLYKSHDGKNNEVKFWLRVFTNTTTVDPLSMHPSAEVSELFRNYYKCEAELISCDKKSNSVWPSKIKLTLVIWGFMWFLSVFTTALKNKDFVQYPK